MRQARFAGPERSASSASASSVSASASPAQSPGRLKRQGHGLHGQPGGGAAHVLREPALVVSWLLRGDAPAFGFGLAGDSRRHAKWLATRSNSAWVMVCGAPSSSRWLAEFFFTASMKAWPSP